MIEDDDVSKVFKFQVQIQNEQLVYNSWCILVWLNRKIPFKLFVKTILKLQPFFD